MIDFNFPKYASLYWGNSTSIGGVGEVSRNEMAIVAEGFMVESGSHMPRSLIMAVSTNARSVWENPSVYYPSQAKFKTLCDQHDWWLRWDNGDIAIGWEQVLPTGTIRSFIFDVSNPACVDAFVALINSEILAKPEFQGFGTLFLDECHAHIMTLTRPHAGKLMMYNGMPTRQVMNTNTDADAAWAKGTKRILRSMPQKIKLMLNGTYSEANAVIGGHFWQSCNRINQIDVFNKAWSQDVDKYDTLQKNLIIHSDSPLVVGGWKAFERLCFYNACLASLLDAYSQVEDNTFQWPINFQVLTQGVFGRPVEYVKGFDMPVIAEPILGLKIREFEYVTVMVNLNTAPIIYQGLVFNPASARVIWKA